MKKLLKEPLVHFILLGVMIFVFYAIIGDKEESENTIVFDTYDLDNILSSWEMQWKRPPTPQELSNLISQNIKQEIFYKEALSMNLDHNDEIIKRRLAQKMQFLSKDLANLNTPSDDELEVYYNKNAQKYQLPSNYTFYQIVFSPDNREDPKRDAQDALYQNKNASIEEIENKGDKLPFKFYFEKVYADDLGAQFGSVFANALKDTSTGTWTGPVPSGFGYHLVYIEEKVEPQIPPLDTIKDKVLTDLIYDQEKLMDSLIYHELKNKYSIEFELDDELVDPETKSVVQNAIN